MRWIVVALALFVAVPAQGEPIQQFKKWLWPHSDSGTSQPWLRPSTIEPAPPPVPPPVVHIGPHPSLPPVIEPATLPDLNPVASREQPQVTPELTQSYQAPRADNKLVTRPRKRPSIRVRTEDTGPDLPWPCWMVRMHAQGKSPAQLKAEGEARGIKLSRKQERQAIACIKGRN